MDNQKSKFIKTNSSVIDDYFKIMRHIKQMKNLQFPNSLSESENLGKKSVYRPDKKLKNRAKSQKSLTNLRASHSTKSTEITSVLFYPKKDEENNNLLMNDKTSSSPAESIDDSHKVDGKT